MNSLDTNHPNARKNKDASLSRLNYSRLEDEALVAACLAGDEQAWETLLARYNRLIYTIPLRFGFSKAMADEIHQETPVDDNARVKAHLADCAVCQQELETMVRLLAGLQQADFAEPNPSATQKLLLAFRKKQARLAARLRQTATLEFDSWANPATANLRRHMGQRQLLFSDGAYDIDLQVMNQAATHNFDLQGQVLKAIVPEERDAFTSLAGLQIRLYDKNDEEWWGVTDDNGRFSFLQLAFGTYTFQLVIDDRDILFEDLEILA